MNCNQLPQVLRCEYCKAMDRQKEKEIALKAIQGDEPESNESRITRIKEEANQLNLRFYYETVLLQQKQGDE